MTKKSDDSGGYLALFFVIGIVVIGLILWLLSPAPHYSNPVVP